MPNENIKSFSSIKRHSDYSPTIVDGTLEEGCTFENCIMEGWGTIIIDKKFIDDILATINENELPTDFVRFLTYINNIVTNYFYSSDIPSKSRASTYADSYVLDDEGMIIGTKLSSLKGKNIALCSEKSIAAFIILEDLYRKGKLTRKPSMVLSTLMTKDTPMEPHAFILLDKVQDDYPTKHLLYDVQNPTLIKDIKNNKFNYVGIYSLSDEQYDSVINGIECTPKSLFEVLNADLHDIGDKRIYGSSKVIKSL